MRQWPQEAVSLILLVARMSVPAPQRRTVHSLRVIEPDQREPTSRNPRVQCAHLSHRDQLKAEVGRLDAVEETPVPSLISASNDAERGRDTYIEAQEGSYSSSIAI